MKTSSQRIDISGLIYVLFVSILKLPESQLIKINT